MKRTYRVRCTCGAVNTSENGRIVHCGECGEKINTNWEEMPVLKEIGKDTKDKALSNLFDFFEKHNFWYDYYDGVAERGYDDKPTICANWNNREGEPNWGKITSWIEEYFEKEIMVDWSDEYMGCSKCYKAVRCSPDSYGWQASYVWVSDCEVVCHECIEEHKDIREDVVTGYVNQDNKAVPYWFYDYMEDMGFVCYSPDEYCKQYASGWHEGQTDNPREIAESIEKELPNHDYMFKVDGVEQFDVHFSVYLRQKEMEA